MFGAAEAASGEYDKSFPPVSSGEVFVEVRSRSGTISDDTARYVADAYLFELSSSFGLDLEVDPRPTLEYEAPRPTSPGPTATGAWWGCDSTARAGPPRRRTART